jgi:hypothetical protein
VRRIYKLFDVPLDDVIRKEQSLQENSDFFAEINGSEGALQGINDQAKRYKKLINWEKEGKRKEGRMNISTILEDILDFYRESLGVVERYEEIDILREYPSIVSLLQENKNLLGSLRQDSVDYVAKTVSSFLDGEKAIRRRCKEYYFSKPESLMRKIGYIVTSSLNYWRLGKEFAEVDNVRKELKAFFSVKDYIDGKEQSELIRAIRTYNGLSRMLMKQAESNFVYAANGLATVMISMEIIGCAYLLLN